MAIHIGDQVRLKKDIPELELRSGEHGEVQSLWFAPALAYEVEFRPDGQFFPTRALLFDEHIAPLGDGSEAAQVMIIQPFDQVLASSLCATGLIPTLYGSRRDTYPHLYGRSEGCDAVATDNGKGGLRR